MMYIVLNKDQKKSLSQFFNNIAVAWFIAAFVTPAIEPKVLPLTQLGFIANIIGALYLSLWFLEEEK